MNNIKNDNKEEKPLSIKHKYKMALKNKKTEYWTDAIGFPGYKVSSFGRIKTPQERISTCSPRKDGYIEVSMKNADGKASMRRLHQVVAASFIPNPENKLEVNHIDGERHNCNITNLEWSTRTENCNKKVNPSESDSSRKIIQLSLEGEEVKIWDSVKDILKSKIISREKLRNCCAEKLKNANGFIWKYYDEHIVLENEKWKNIEHKGKTINISTHGRAQYKDGRKTYGGTQKTDGSYMTFQKYKVHRLVMLAHKPNDNAENLVVDHIDGNTKNNKIENLRWATHSQNTQYSYDNGRKSKGHTHKKITQHTIGGEFIKKFNSLSEASKELKISEDGIGHCVSGRSKSCGGYFWKYDKSEKKEKHIEI
jgi:hypothetical protein